MPSRTPAAIQYRICPADPHAHLFEVELRIAKPDADGQRLWLPAWIPGSYLIREFARQIVEIEARSARRAVALRKIDKHTWAAAPVAGPLVVRYRVYAWDLSVRGAHLDATHGFFNGTSVFLAAAGHEHEPCTVELLPPPATMAKGWRVATTLPTDGARDWGFGRYRAADYDELVDHPVEMGHFVHAGFEAGGIRHDVAITGRHDCDLNRLTRDLRRVCEAQVRLFEPRSARAPMRRYLFLVTATTDGYGGLEHRDSTALICARKDLPYPGMSGVPDGYRGFLGLASHEYFHCWNVKRIKPAAFAPYRLDRESYTRLLWVFEGFTSYYDDLMLVRSGVIDRNDYLKALSKSIASVLRNPGRRLQSVAESSFDAWTRFYRQDENSPNVLVSYYGKGAIVALALDLAIRLRSNHRRSLDDVMRLLWQRYGRDFEHAGIGVPEDAMPALIEEATGVDLTAEIMQWAHGTEDPPIAALLEPFGVAYSQRAPDGPSAWIGARLAQRNGDCVVSTVLSDSPAHRAGLSAGDVLAAIDGLRVRNEADVKAALGRHAPGERLPIDCFRGDVLMRVTLSVADAPPEEVELRYVEGARAARRGSSASR